jgi:hypothetical protein
VVRHQASDLESRRDGGQIDRSADEPADAALRPGIDPFEAGAGTKTSDNQFSGNQHNFANVP